MKKRESRKCDGICGKNEENSGRSRSSIKEDSGRDEEICRQRKKRNRKIEERRLGTIEH